MNGEATLKQLARIEADQHAARLRGTERQLKDARRSIEKWIAKFEEAEERLDVALALKQARRGKALKVSATSDKARRTESTAFLIGSDWHVEETVDPATCNGRNVFNLGVADARIKNFFTKGYRLCEIQRSATDINTLVVALLGDHMTGYIHEELVEDNSLSPTQTILWLMPRIESGLNFLRRQFKRVVVVCAVGNHGRTTEKRRVSTAYKNSYEWLMYHLLAQRFEGSNVEFKIVNSYHNLLPVYDYTIRFHHGDNIRFQGGVGGLYIPARKKIHQWNNETRAHLDVFGHHHQFSDGGSFISNSSLIGYNAFAVSIGATYEPPTQTFFLVHPQRFKTLVAPVWLE